MCGGQGEDEQYSESYVMAKYLVENGIPQERIIQESKSSNTVAHRKEYPIQKRASVFMMGLVHLQNVKFLPI